MSSNALPTNGWVHTVVTRSAGWFQIYLNGAASGAPSFVATLVNAGPHTFVIGAEPGFLPASFFGGMMDDVRIYGRALTPGEVLAVYNGA